MKPSADCFAVVLAGGEGSRFWPASRPDRPKQLLPLGSSRPLIQDTLDRAEILVGRDRVRVIASEPLVAALCDAAPGLAIDRFFVEPQPRSTGPALAWAAFEIERAAPGSIMISLHADHVIHPLEGLVETIERAVSAARRGSLVCIGIEPDRPETGYGYIEVGAPTGDLTWRARRFVEKPDSDTAEQYVASGGFLWNSGIFVWRAADLLTAVRELAPEISGALPLLEDDGPGDFFEAVQPVSVDVAVMERSANVEVVRASFDWDDVGSWSALARTRETDGQGNVLVGDSAAIDSARNIVWAEDGKVVLFDVTDLVVVRSGGVTMVARAASAPDLKRLVGRLRSEGG
ncbi:MAG: sugar phosphate nucleotidyltransferase [Candidatus Palauibacterales bacterium]|jgi:mannose-1-phosphate guanylyltransferase|nr:sugar phosphate nucleotidyltransferase [Candidatus Palauibacterales bacterium]